MDHIAIRSCDPCRPGADASPGRSGTWRPGRLVLAATVALGLATAAQGQGQSPAAVSPSAASATPPAQALSPCRLPGLPNEVLCGSVRRPLDPAAPLARQIDVHYVVVPAMARRKLPDPVLLLAGGPGQSAIGLAPTVMPLFSRLNNRRDIIFIDQRGTGRSAPLECPTPVGDSMADQTSPERQRQLLSRCREVLAKLPQVQGAEGLRYFTTTLAMQDVDAVRRQLGAARVNVVGGSYGTRAALELLRQFPAQVRRTVLDGVAPPDMVLPLSMSTDGQTALDAMLDACRRDPACHTDFPHLKDHWASLLASLPRPIQARDPRTGRAESLTLSREMLMAAVRAPLYAPAMASALPRAITEAAAGRYEALIGLNTLLMPSPRRKSPTALAVGMHFSVVCAEDMPRLARSTDQPGRDFGASSRELYEQVCADWPRGQVPAAFYSLPPSGSPVLLLSGGLDPVTPPRHGERVAAALGPMATHRVVPNAGHGVMAIGCMRDVIFRFVDAEDEPKALAVDSRCVEGIPRPPALPPLAAVGTGVAP